jgi:DNA-directed RNA polymerase subunit M/transcription elongation factor TFIIS
MANSEGAPAPKALEAAAAALTKALEAKNPDLDEWRPAYMRWLASELASELAKTQSATFARSVRSLCFNLAQPHNHATRVRFCARELSPCDVCAMGSAEWASAEMRAQRDAAEERGFRNRVITEDGAARTTSVTCPACGARDAMGMQLGAKRDIGKSETWGSKDTSDMTRLECSACGHVWHADYVEFDDPAAAAAKRVRPPSSSANMSSAADSKAAAQDTSVKRESPRS